MSNLLIKLILCAFYVNTISGNRDINDRVCEPIRIEQCQHIGYNLTSMPNLVDNELQSEADFMIKTFVPLLQYGCSAQLNLFLCSAYVPMCTEKVPLPIGPCRGLCETVRSRCHPLLNGFGFPWPPALDCNRFPETNTQEHMCMEGPGENEIEPQTAPPPKISVQPSCQMLSKSHLYVRLNRSAQCAPLCEADILFDTREKYSAEMWITTWSIAALFIAFIAIMCLIFSDTKWDKILMPLVTCHTLVAVGWTVRWIAGRNQTACGMDPQLPGVSLLLTDGPSNAPCAINFLLRYYFGMSASVWWAILSLKWHLTVRRTINESLSEQPAEKNKDSYGSLIQLAAWGLPSLQTVAVLVAQLVDADELLGSCFVGNQSDKALRILVAMPLFCYWIFGAINLFAGYLVKRLNTNTKSIYPATINGIGTFLFVYCIPSAFLLVAIFYEFANRDIWLGIPQPSSEPSSSIKAPMWPYMVRAFMELLLGVLTSSWALGPRISTFWHSKTETEKTKQSQPKFPTTAYSTASYQSVCPQNCATNMASSNGKVPRHGRKYSPAYNNTSRKPRSYKVPTQYSHTISLTGNETVF